MKTIYIATARSVAARILGEEMLVMSVLDSTLFSLSEVATVIWTAADGSTPLSEIVDRYICAEFDVPRDVALRDAEVFVEELSKHGILRISDCPILDGPPGENR